MRIMWMIGSAILYSFLLLWCLDHVDPFIARTVIFCTPILGSVAICVLCTRKKREQDHYERAIKRLHENVASSELSRSEIYFTHSPLAVIEWNADFTVRSWNAKAEQTFGFTAKEIIGQHASVIVPKNYQYAIVEAMHTILENKLGHKSVFKNVTKSGEKIYCEWYNTPITDSRGHMTVYSLVQDITQRKQAENTLRDNQQMLDGIFRALRDIVYVIDAHGVVTYANPWGYDLLHIPTERRNDMRLEEILDADELHIARERIRILLTTQNLLPPQIYHLKVYDSDTDAIPVECVDVPFFVKKQLKILGVARPISDRLELERERARLQRMQSISTLAGGVAHDFNNLLTMIGGSAFLMVNGEKESQMRNCENILKAIRRASGLTRQLGNLASGGGEKKEAASVAEIIKETATLFGESTQCRFEIILQDDMCPCMIDKEKIGQVFQNLFLNAIHAMPGGGVIHVSGEKVRLEAHNACSLQAGVYAYIEVRDSGCGIAKKDLSRIFEPYFTTKSASEGTGLGLYVTYVIISEHGGYIGVESIVGKGTTFHIYLPACEALKEKKEEVAENMIQSKKYHILVVDDEEMNRDIMSQIVHILGHTCEVAADGHEALRVYDHARHTGAPFDLVITDLTIPGGMGGKKLIPHLKNRDPSLAVIVSSGYVEHDLTHVDGLLPKPYEFQKIKRVIEVTMQGR